MGKRLGIESTSAKRVLGTRGRNDRPRKVLDMEERNGCTVTRRRVRSIRWSKRGCSVRVARQLTVSLEDPTFPQVAVGEWEVNIPVVHAAIVSGTALAEVVSPSQRREVMQMQITGSLDSESSSVELVYSILLCSRNEIKSSKSLPTASAAHTTDGVSSDLGWHMRSRHLEGESWWLYMTGGYHSIELGGDQLVLAGITEDDLCGVAVL